jgi:hypothetical protein
MMGYERPKTKVPLKTKFAQIPGEHSHSISLVAK